MAKLTHKDLTCSHPNCEQAAVVVVWDCFNQRVGDYCTDCGNMVFREQQQIETEMGLPLAMPPLVTR